MGITQRGGRFVFPFGASASGMTLATDGFSPVVRWAQKYLAARGVIPGNLNPAARAAIEPSLAVNGGELRPHARVLKKAVVPLTTRLLIVGNNLGVERRARD